LIAAMIYVYAVAELPATGSPPVAATRGLGGARVELRAIGPVCVAYTSHPPGSMPPTAQNVWLHEGVVEALMPNGAVLPARFGTVFADEAALDQALGSQAGRLTAGLDRVRGCVELGLRVLWRQTDVPAAMAGLPLSDDLAGPANADLTPGRAYMAARLDRERRSRETQAVVERLAADIYAELAVLARDSTRRVLASPAPQMSAAYLVPTPQADTFNARVRQIAARHPDVRLLCTGPWPPYHFVPAFAALEASHA